MNASAPFITGTPTQAGACTITVQGWNNINATGFTNDVLVPIAFNVTAATVAPPVVRR